MSVLLNGSLEPLDNKAYIIITNSLAPVINLDEPLKHGKLEALYYEGLSHRHGFIRFSRSPG